MPLWFQHILVLLLVAACGGVIVYNLVQTFRHKPSRLGSCCAKGCPPADPAQGGQKTAFVPLEALARRRK